MNMMHTNTAHTNLTCTNMTHTNITHTTTLSRKEQEDIRRITSLCRLTDGLSLSCPEDGDEYWLLEEDATAAAFLAVYKTEETMWECYAFTHPDFRRKGYFSALLEQVCQYSEALGEPELCLVTDNKCPAATAALRELGAELWNEEYMKIRLPRLPAKQSVGRSGWQKAGHGTGHGHPSNSGRAAHLRQKAGGPSRRGQGWHNFPGQG